jgi:hypothetical protein
VTDPDTAMYGWNHEDGPPPSYDPDAGLAALRDLIGDYLGHPDGLEYGQLEDLVGELVALDVHMSTGGILPRWWQAGTAQPPVTVGWDGDRLTRTVTVAPEVTIDGVTEPCL